MDDLWVVALAVGVTVVAAAAWIGWRWRCGEGWLAERERELSVIRLESGAPQTLISSVARLLQDEWPGSSSGAFESFARDVDFSSLFIHSQAQAGAMGGGCFSDVFALVCTRDGRALGHARVERTRSHPDGSVSVALYSLVVARRLRGRGLGAVLVRGVLAQLRGYAVQVRDVRVSTPHPRLVAFYQRELEFALAGARDASGIQSLVKLLDATEAGASASRDDSSS
jgi:GNAT superfamily N-acetyltransferase